MNRLKKVEHRFGISSGWHMRVHRLSVKCLMVLQFSYMDSLFKEIALKKIIIQLANGKIKLVLNSKFACRITQRMSL